MKKAFSALLSFCLILAFSLTVSAAKSQPVFFGDILNVYRALASIDGKVPDIPDPLFGYETVDLSDAEKLSYEMLKYDRLLCKVDKHTGNIQSVSLLLTDNGIDLAAEEYAKERAIAFFTTMELTVFPNTQGKDLYLASDRNRTIYAVLQGKDLYLASNRAETIYTNLLNMLEYNRKRVYDNMADVPEADRKSYRFADGTHGVYTVGRNVDGLVVHIDLLR